MSKSSRSASNTHKNAKAGWPLVVYIWMAGFGFLGYMVFRVALDVYPHPVHWLGGLGSGFIGYGIGWLWYRWRGDIV
jgi:hypothetical protein